MDAEGLRPPDTSSSEACALRTKRLHGLWADFERDKFKVFFGQDGHAPWVECSALMCTGEQGPGPGTTVTLTTSVLQCLLPFCFNFPIPV